MAKTIFEELGGKYERQGDYLIPCIPPPLGNSHLLPSDNSHTFLQQ